MISSSALSTDTVDSTAFGIEQLVNNPAISIKKNVNHSFFIFFIIPFTSLMAQISSENVVPTLLYFIILVYNSNISPNAKS